MTTTSTTSPANARPEDPERDALLRAIAAVELGFSTLETRRHDSLDFREVAVWGAREALERAYEAGRQAGRDEAEQAVHDLLKLPEPGSVRMRLRPFVKPPSMSGTVIVPQETLRAVIRDVERLEALAAQAGDAGRGGGVGEGAKS